MAIPCGGGGKVRGIGCPPSCFLPLLLGEGAYCPSSSNPAVNLSCCLAFWGGEGGGVS